MLVSSAPARAIQPVDSLEFYINESHYLKGIAFAKKTANRQLQQGQFFGYAKTTVRQAEIFNLLNDKQRALKMLLDALKIVEKQKDRRAEIVILDKIGNIYDNVKQFDRAKKYYHSAIAKARKIKNDSLEGRIAQPLFRIYHYEKSDSAAYYLQKTLIYNRSLGTNDAMSTAYTNYFAYYHSLGEHQKAKVYLDSSLYYARKSISKKRLSIALSNLVYHQMLVEKDFKKAKATYKKIFTVSPHDTLSDGAAEIYLNYSYLLEQLGEYKDALLYMDKAIGIQDAALNNKTDRMIRDLELRYQIDKVETEYLARQKMLEEKQSKNRKIFAVFVALLILSLILFYFFHQNTRLKQNNKLKDIESRVQQNIINATIDGQEIERKKIAAVLHDNISAMLSSAGLQLSAYVAGIPEPPQEIAKTRAILKETHDKVRDLSHELVPVLLSKFGLVYAVQDLCEKNTTSLITVDFEHGIVPNKRFNEDYEMKIFFIITELLNNIIKHSGANHAKLAMHEHEALLTITATDNGLGFDTSKPHLNEGFGLTQIRARVSNMKGTFNIASRHNAGTTVTIVIPVQQ